MASLSTEESRGQEGTKNQAPSFLCRGPLTLLSCSPTPRKPRACAFSSRGRGAWKESWQLMGLRPSHV